MADIKCEFIEWEFKCPKRWEVLEITDRDDVRFCYACHEKVYGVTDKLKAKELAAQGKCIALIKEEEMYAISTVGVLIPDEKYIDPRSTKLEIEKKIKKINTRMKKYGETPEQLARLKSLYEGLAEVIGELLNSD